MTTHQYNRFCQMITRGTKDLYYLKADSDPAKVDSWKEVIYEDIQSVFVNTPGSTALSLDFYRYKDELPNGPEIVPLGSQDIEMHSMSFMCKQTGTISSVQSISVNGIWLGYPKKLFVNFQSLTENYLHTTHPRPASLKTIWLPCSKQK